MNWLQVVAIASLVVVAVVAGGAAIRLAVVVVEPQVGATVGLVAVLVAVAARRGARGRRWRENPYW